jgi:hypothetical protein
MFTSYVMRVRNVCYFDEYVVRFYLLNLHMQNASQVLTSLPLVVIFNILIVSLFRIHAVCPECVGIFLIVFFIVFGVGMFPVSYLQISPIYIFLLHIDRCTEYS